MFSCAREKLSRAVMVFVLVCGGPYGALACLCGSPGEHSTGILPRLTLPQGSDASKVRRSHDCHDREATRGAGSRENLSAVDSGVPKGLRITELHTVLDCGILF